MTLPRHAHQFRKGFKKWLADHGAQMIPTTNPWELLRFRASKGVGVVYRNQADELSFTGEAATAYMAYASRKPWEGTPKVKRRKKKSDQMVKALIKRDGRKCFYCGLPMLDGEETLEHLLSLNHGGPDHIANLALAHRDCNLRAKSRPLIEKIALRDKMHRGSERNAA